jgi:hypothetical protein
MGQAIGQSLPLAVGVALSPIPIIAVVLTTSKSSPVLAFGGPAPAQLAIETRSRTPWGAIGFERWSAVYGVRLHRHSVRG